MTTERTELLAVTQADRDAAKAHYPPHLWKQEAIDDLALAFARHRLAALTDAPRDREGPETFSAGVEGVPDRVLRLDALVFADRMDFTIHHRESKEAWLAVRAGLERIKGEIDRILSNQNRCPFRPGGPKGLPLLAPPAIAPEGFVVDRERASRVADAVCVRVCELPDRTSPDDWPEACLVTSDELHEIVSSALEALLAAAETAGAGSAYTGESNDMASDASRDGDLDVAGAPQLGTRPANFIQATIVELEQDGAFATDDIIKVFRAMKKVAAAPTAPPVNEDGV